jgi:hypothetical protein
LILVEEACNLCLVLFCFMFHHTPFQSQSISANLFFTKQI